MTSHATTSTTPTPTRHRARTYAAIPAALAGVSLAGAGLILTGTGTASAATVSTAAVSTDAVVVHPAASSHATAAAQPAPSQQSPLDVSTGPVTLAPRGSAAASLAPAASAPASPAATPAHHHATASAPARRAAPKHRPSLASELTPVGTSGPQAWMPISRSQLENATTIVRQAVHKGMGLRSAVIAVATSMQESKLVNIDYGTSDSLGLFQQQPDCGWGTSQQVMNPVFAADAFLSALHEHQLADRSWKSQPLWANAQAVQNSAFPFAYAKWETQAAHLVNQIAG